MRKRYYNREEAVNAYKNKIKTMLDSINHTMNIEELKMLYKQTDNLYTDKMVESIALRKKVSNSTLLKHHYQKKRDVLRSEIQEIDAKNTAYQTAIEICEMFKLNDTSSFSPAMLSDEFIEKVIDYKIEQEKSNNEKVKKTGEGKKSNKYSAIYEEFDESQYPFLNME